MKLKGVRNQVDVRVAVEIEDLTRVTRGTTPIVTKVPFVISVRRFTRAEWAEHAEEIKDLSGQELNEFIYGLLLDNVVGWRELKDQDDVEVEFSEDALKEVLDYQDYFAAISTGFFEAQVGRRALEKNS